MEAMEVCCRKLEEPIVVVVVEEMQEMGLVGVQVLYF